MSNIPPFNPYDPNLIDYSPETPQLDQVINLAIRAALLNLRVHLPGKVTKVVGNQLVNVQPLIKSQYIDGTVFDLPEIQNVPVSMPMGQNYSIKLPIAIGDIGNILFSDRSLDNWISGDGSSVDSEDSRIHDITDAVFIPGLVTFSSQTQDETDDLVITNGKAQLRLEQGGMVKLQNLNSNEELITLLLSLLDLLQNNTFTLTALGPQPFIASTVTALADIQAKLQTLKG